VSSHTSVVQSIPSSHDVVDPPAEHCPAEQVRAVVHASLSHDDSAHTVPFGRTVHAEVLFMAEQIWHGLSGFAVPSSKQAPPIMQYPAWSAWLHPRTGSHASVVQ
jgi:hypothetical protein